MHKPLTRQAFRRSRLVSVAVTATVLTTIMAGPVFALSTLPPAENVDQLEADSAPAAAEEAPAAEDGEDTGGDTLIEKVAPLVEKLTGSSDEIVKDLSTLPEPVARMRQLIMAAAASGDLSAVATLMNPGPNQTTIGPDDSGNDLATALKDMSGDEDGMEILAIMLDVLSTGYAHVGKGSPDEAYVWPYFVRAPIDQLSPPEKVDLMRIVTAGDYSGMLEFGGYNFYRIGISPDGQWRFFLAGD